MSRRRPKSGLCRFKSNTIYRHEVVELALLVIFILLLLFIDHTQNGTQ